MLSFAKNDRGIRLISSAILFLPLAAMILAMSRSSILDAAVTLGWCAFACIAFIAFLYERTEEDERDRRE